MVVKKSNEDEDIDPEIALDNSEVKEDEEEIFTRIKWAKWVALSLFVVNAIVFILTEDMRLPMIIVDKWTIIHILALLATILVFNRGMNKQYKQYTITYFVNGVAYKEQNFRYDEEIEPIESPYKEGYTFSGWDKPLPDKMPKHNIEVKGSVA